MENLFSFIQVLVALFLILSVIMNYGQRIKMKFLTKKFDLLKKMFWEESDFFNDDEIKETSIDLIEELKEEIVCLYAKQIKEWDPDEIGNYFLELERLEDDKKRLTLMSFFKQAMASMSNDNLVAIYFTAFKFGLENRHSNNIKALQKTKNLILENALKTGKSSRRIKIFYYLLESMPLEAGLNADQMIAFYAEMAENKKLLFNECDIINESV